MKKQMIFSLSIFLVFLLAGCDIIANAIPSEIPEETEPQPENEEGATVIITPAIKENLAVLFVGDTLVVQIPTIPTEGFEWVVQDLDTTILVQEGASLYKQDIGTDSAGGITVMNFKAVGTGETNLNLAYVKPTTDQSPSLAKNTFGVKITVRGSGGETIAIRPQITGNSASLIVGDTLVVEIPTIPSEGFEWIVQNLDTNVLVQEGSSIYKRDTRSADAAGGITYLTFTAVGPGKINLSMVYASEASEDLPSFSKKSFGVSVTVREAGE